MGFDFNINCEPHSDAAGKISWLSPCDGFRYIPAGPAGITDPDNKYVLTLKIPFSGRMPSPGECAVLGYLEYGRESFQSIGMIHFWDHRTGCSARWIIPDGNDLIVYNDMIDSKDCAVIYDPEMKKAVRVLSSHISDITADGKTAAAIEFSNLKKLSAEGSAVVRVDTENGSLSEILSCEDILGFKSDEAAWNAVHSIDSLRISPDGRKILFIHTIKERDKTVKRLLVCDINGKNLRLSGDRTLEPLSVCWNGNDEITGIFRKNGGAVHFYCIDVFNNQPQLFWAELDNIKGFNPLCENGMFAAECYNAGKKSTGLYLLTKKDKRSRLLAQNMMPESCNTSTAVLPAAGNDSFVVSEGMRNGKKALFTIDIHRPDLERYDRAAEKMHSVAVVMATYNGERFLKEQLDSLIVQKGVRVNILVRDDGSTDKTKTILEDYQSRGLLKWYTGEHLNVQKGFLDLLKNAPQADYYAFCDQDDVWDDDKLLAAVTELDEMDNSKPAMYYCGQKLVDEELELISVHSVYTQRNPHTNFFFSNVAGCTAVFNRQLLDALNSAEPEFIHCHDNWAFKVCLALGGSYVVDPVSRINYRQHGGNAVGLNVGIKGRYRQVKRYMSIKLKKQCENLLLCYGDRMTPEYKKIAEDICNYDLSFKNRKKLLRESDVDFKNRSFNYVIKLKVFLKKL